MPKLLALWTSPHDPQGFDADYLATHVPLAQALPGVRFTASKALAGPYYRVAELAFDSMEALQGALGSPEAGKVMEDAQRLQERFGATLDTLVLTEG